MRKSDAFVVAAWASFLFGLLEGVVLCVTRQFPLIEAAHKVSNHALWVAPLVDLPFFLLAAAALLPLLSLARRWVGGREMQFLYGFFFFLGLCVVITMPRVIQPFGVLVLVFGLATVLVRGLQGRLEGLTVQLRRRLFWIPVLFLTVIAGVYAFDGLLELWKFRSLSAPVLKPNVLVIVLDTVRADRYAGVAGGSLVPNLDRMAAQGVRYSNAWSTSSWSLPSQASVLTGCFPSEHEADWPRIRLNARCSTLAELLRDQGYVTGAFSGNASWVTPEYLGPGFLRFRVYLLEDLIRRTVLGRRLSRLLEYVRMHPAGRGKKAGQLNREFLDFLDDYPNRPFFAFLCYMDVNRGFHNRRFNFPDRGHLPIPAMLSAYDAALKDLDQELGDLFEALQRRRTLDETIVIVVSDHGESFGKENPGDHDPSDHGTSLYREQLEVPLFVRYPKGVRSGLAVSQTASVQQIPATVVRLLGIDSPFPGDPLPLVGDTNGNTDELGPCALAELRDLHGRRTHESLVCGNWQYIHYPGVPRKVPAREELFDLIRDPRAVANLMESADHQEKLARMRMKLQGMLKARLGASESAGGRTE